MDNKKSTIITICFYLLIFLLPVLGSLPDFLTEAQMNPFDYARITDIDYTAVVMDEPDGEASVRVTERLTFDVHAASKSNPFRELWRDLSEESIDGVKVDYTVHSVKQILKDGSEVIYEESPRLYWEDYDYVRRNTKYGPGKWFHSPGPYNESARKYECVFFYVDELYREEVVFEIVYDVHNAGLKYNDCCDLYLFPCYGSQMKHLDSFNAQILFPNEDMPSPGNYDVFTYGTNANEFPVEESATMNPGYYTFYFDLDEDDLKFRPYNEYIEFELVAYGEDSHVFTDYAPDNWYSNDDVLDEIYDEYEAHASTPAKFRVAKIILLILSVLATALILKEAYKIDDWISSKHIFYSSTLEAGYYRDIPSDLDPNFAAALVYCKHKPPKDDSGVYSAILLSLARKKYVTLKENLDDVDITLLPENPTGSAEPLTPCEEYYYNLLVRHATLKKISMQYFKNCVTMDYENTNSFATNMKNSIVNIGVKDGYFQKSDYKQPQKQIKKRSNVLLVIGILTVVLGNIISYHTRMDLAFGAYFILGIGFILSAVYLRKQSRKYVLLTAYGEEENAKWRGLYNFLNSETLIHDRTIIELPVWEKYLVYATAFGLSEKIIEAISIRCPEFDTNPTFSGSGYRSTSFYRSSGRSFHSSVRSGSSSWSSGGGGYGGGGRGGGVGGGGH